MSNAASTKEIVTGYTNAWVSKDLEKAGTFLAEDLTFRGSLEKHESAASFLAGFAQFLPMVTGMNEVEAAWLESKAFLLYDLETAGPGGTMRCAEILTVEGQKITDIKLVFDASALRAAQA